LHDCQCKRIKFRAALFKGRQGPGTESLVGLGEAQYVTMQLFIAVSAKDSPHLKFRVKMNRYILL
jgi:hypothetical protein